MSIGVLFFIHFDNDFDYDDNYNAMGKYLNKTFELLGGNPLVTIGLGNDDDDIENDFELWKENILWPKLCKQYLPETMNDNDAVTKTNTTMKH